MVSKPFPGSDELNGHFAVDACDEGHDFDVNCVACSLGGYESAQRARGEWGGPSYSQPSVSLRGCFAQVFC